MRAVYSAIRLDFGSQFVAAVPSDKDANAWKWRLYRKLDGLPVDVVVDGYERAVSERRPYMPSLVDIVDATRCLHRERLAAAAIVERVSAPRFSGLAGYVDGVLGPNARGEWAQKHIALMRDVIRRRPAAGDADRRESLDRSVAEYDALLARTPAAPSRGMYRGCAAHGCGRPGSHTHSVNALSATWFCADHWRHR